MEKYILTKLQFQKYQSDLNKERENLAKLKISEAEARAEGDSSENSPLDTALAKLAQSTSVIEKLEDLLNNSIIDDSIAGSELKTVKVNSEVRLQELIGGVPGDIFEIQFVGTRGEYPNKVSVESKLGQVLKNANVGSAIEYIDNMHKVRCYQILSAVQV